MDEAPVPPPLAPLAPALSASMGERARQAAEIVGRPQRYKICEGCESIVSRRGAYLSELLGVPVQHRPAGHRQAGPPPRQSRTNGRDGGGFALTTGQERRVRGEVGEVIPITGIVQRSTDTSWRGASGCSRGAVSPCLALGARHILADTTTQHGGYIRNDGSTLQDGMMSFFLSIIPGISRPG